MTARVNLSMGCDDAGIVTSALAGLLGQARLYVVLGRERLLPPGLAQIHPSRATPVNATVLSACTAGVALALSSWRTWTMQHSLCLRTLWCCQSCKRGPTAMGARMKRLLTEQSTS